jgi:hypothetical protein
VEKLEERTFGHCAPKSSFLDSERAKVFALTVCANDNLSLSDSARELAVRQKLMKGRKLPKQL